MFLRTIILAGLTCALVTAAEHRGVVRSAGLPIPGASVTARQGDQRIATSTDESGSYVFQNLAAGTWKIEVEMMGFAPASREVRAGDSAPPLEIDLRLQPAQAAPAAAVPQVRPGAAKGQAGAPQGQNGTSRRDPAAAAFQRLAVTQAAQNEVQAALNAPPPEPASPEFSQNANESFLVTGSLSRGLQSPQSMDEAFGGQSREEMRARFQGMRGGGSPGSFGGGGPMMGRGGMPMGGLGGPGGFGGGYGAGGPGGGPMSGRMRGGSSFGNRNGRGRDSIRGGAFFSLRNSVLDAKPYSLSGQSIAKPSYAQSRFGLVAGGLLRIPKIFTSDKTFFFVSYFGTRSRNPYDSIATVPSLLERGGDFSQSIARVPVTIFDPLSSQPFPNNRIPAARMNPAARGLLDLIPLPNQPGVVQNYQLVTSVPQNTDNFGLRLNRSVAKKDRFSGSFNLQQRNGSSAQLFGFRDASTGRGFSLEATWTHTFAASLISSLRGYFNRNSSDLLPFFAYGADWARELGIRGTSNDPRNYGPPNLTFTNFGALTDGSPSVQHNQTAGVSEGLIRTKGKHTLSLGADYHRMQLNSRSDQNARGTYIFSGLATSGFDANGFPLAATGFDFADYLLGLPQSSSIRFGSSDVYFRGSAYSAYSQDDWRLRSNLTLNFGLRYEYLAPLHEKYGRMANLDIAPNFTAVAVVTPGVSGPYSGAFSDGLVNPDPNNLAPRFGLAWKPWSKKQTQIRAGYGWYYNGSVYNAAASRLAQQSPFARSASINTSTGRPLTIEDGFATAPSKQINNTFAIDRYYRVGYAQTWNVAFQQDLPFSTVLEIGYLGTKGTRLDIQRLPNRAAPGSPLTSEQRRQIANASGFTFESSEGDSIYHAAQVRISRRFRNGFSANALYTYSKSIDNASTFGGGAVVVAQDDHNLAAERGLSSFDRRHNLNLFYIFTTSGTPGSDARRSAMLRDWQLSGGATIRSGSPFTATVLGNRSDAGGSGAVGSGRADATGLPVTLAGAFFDPAAFSLPAAGRFGNAGRNTISGPSFFSLNLALGRSIRFGESRRSVDLRVEANNLLNSVSIVRIGTTVNSSNYGLALEAGSMRSINLNLRFRF